MEVFDIYKDIEARCKGTMYLGVVGPVRTGKSTFIKRFMDLMVLPNMTDLNAKEQAKDELPQSAGGVTVMTAEPKFVPKEAATIRLMNDLEVKVRLVDCVGYMVNGAMGHMEDGQERMVKTPWFAEDIPFTKAAEVGTQKVIRDHATIGIVVTTDGSAVDLPRESYIEAEQKTIRELKAIGKPFVVLLNSKKPFSQETKRLAEELQDQYEVAVMPLNCEQMREEDIHRIMEKILFEFPVSEICYYIPKWVELLPKDHKIKSEIVKYIRDILMKMREIKDAVAGLDEPDTECIEYAGVDYISTDTGCVKVRIQVADRFYYEMLSELVGSEVRSEYDLIHMLKELSHMKSEYEEVRDAMNAVQQKGYGVVHPRKEEIHVDEPVLIKQGNKYGVKIHSEAPSIHMIRANIETEIAPIVGDEQQANDLVAYIKENSQTEEGIWGTNIFGKSIEEMLMDGMKHKIATINDESQMKLQDTMQKIVNDNNGGLVCIII